MSDNQPPMTIFTIPIHEVFTEWDRQWREDPRGFQSNVERILAGQTIDEYGHSAEATLIGIARDMAEARGVFA